MANLKQKPAISATGFLSGRISHSLPANDRFGMQQCDHKRSMPDDRCHEAVALDRWFWFSIGVLLSIGAGLSIWIWLH
ncbi:hypothetical protein GC197_11200 [bacterium]|nr:hypothetical protein [bacterium]